MKPSYNSIPVQNDPTICRPQAQVVKQHDEAVTTTNTHCHPFTKTNLAGLLVLCVMILCIVVITVLRRNSNDATKLLSSTTNATATAATAATAATDDFIHGIVSGAIPFIDNPNPPLVPSSSSSSSSLSSSISISISKNKTAEIRRHFVSATLGSNMVLQRDRPVPIWGFSSQPGAVITTTLYYYATAGEKNKTDTDTNTDTNTDTDTTNNMKKDKNKNKNNNNNSDNNKHLVLTTTASSDPNEHGIWRQFLPPHPASMDPMTILIESSSNTSNNSTTTPESKALTNILFGDVYVCGGQSNMEFTLAATTNATQEAQWANQYPHIRVFTVGQGTTSEHRTLDDLQSIQQPWSVADAQSVCDRAPFRKNGVLQQDQFQWTYFSSVCWFFGKEVADGLHNTVPIGLISNNWGGTTIEVWQPGGTLYNAMMYPYMMGPMALTGFTWYQGESNAENQVSADAYSINFPSMIESWFNGFNMTNNNNNNNNDDDDKNKKKNTYDHNNGYYFGFIQLSTWCLPDNTDAIPELRKAQMSVLNDDDDGVDVRAASFRKIGYATNADHGAGCNIHPPSKQYCGKRLGRSALALQYGQQDIHWKSPSYWTAAPSSTTTTTRTTTVVTTTLPPQEQKQPDSSSSSSLSSSSVMVEEVAEVVMIFITLQDVSSPKGLYLLEEPFNTLNGIIDCSQQSPGICGYPSILLNDNQGWRNATIELAPSSSSSGGDNNEPNKNQVIFKTAIQRLNGKNKNHDYSHFMDHDSHSNTSIIVSSTTSSSTSNGNTDYDNVSVLATSYGWGGVPMMTLYDAGTDLPVLPWREHV